MVQEGCGGKERCRGVCPDQQDRAKTSRGTPQQRAMHIRNIDVASSNKKARGKSDRKEAVSVVVVRWYRSAAELRRGVYGCARTNKTLLRHQDDHHSHLQCSSDIDVPSSTKKAP